MTRRAAVALVAATLTLGGVGAAAAMTTTDDDPGRWDRSSMMGPRMHMGPQVRMGPQVQGPRAQMGLRMMHHTQVSSEYAFLAEMVAHHEEAITAARELERSDRAEMRRFGASIVSSQSAQVEQMERWLEQWYADESGRVDYEPMMRDLSDLSGDDLDEAFLSDMVGHHMGAVMMSQQLLVRGLADHPEVAELAATIRDEQHAEIFTMRRWLQDWFDDGWGHGMRMNGPMPWHGGTR